MSLKLLQFPGRDLSDIPGGLRRLADAIEAGEYGGVGALAWVMDTHNEIQVGLLGSVGGNPGPVAYFMLGCGQRQFEP